mmetsp:Transcript_13319/g.43030  ORF Transcript_13319/g.43030 Transcript_13319/m.43030 type:complete len:235 (-) Transcript_13319:182-886(-)
MESAQGPHRGVYAESVRRTSASSHLPHVPHLVAQTRLTSINLKSSSRIVLLEGIGNTPPLQLSQGSDAVQGLVCHIRQHLVVPIQRPAYLVGLGGQAIEQLLDVIVGLLAGVTLLLRARIRGELRARCGGGGGRGATSSGQGGAAHGVVSDQTLRSSLGSRFALGVPNQGSLALLLLALSTLRVAIEEVPGPAPSLKAPQQPLGLVQVVFDVRVMVLNSMELLGLLPQTFQGPA